MLVRITRKEQDGTTVLQVEGGLSSDFVREMARECDSLDEAYLLDLTHLHCVDAAGAALLADLALKGVEMRGASPYVALRMQRYLPSDILQTPRSSGAETSSLPCFAELAGYGTPALVGK